MTTFVTQQEAIGFNSLGWNKMIWILEISKLSITYISLKNFSYSAPTTFANIKTVRSQVEPTVSFKVAIRSLSSEKLINW